MNEEFLTFRKFNTLNEVEDVIDVLNPNCSLGIMFNNELMNP